MEILQADIARYKRDSKGGEDTEADGLETAAEDVSLLQGEVAALKDSRRKLSNDIYVKELILSRRRRQGGGDTTAVQV